MSVTLRLAARDPGAANVVAGLFLALPDDLRRSADIWAMEKAVPRLSSLNLPLRLFADTDGEAALAAACTMAWAEAPAAALITGTSHYAPFDDQLWAIARRFGTPSLALVDYWANLPQRFRRGFPDAVGALDPRQADELAALGLPRERILVTGHPWLARVAAEAARTAACADRAGDRTIRVLFVSERIHDDVAEGAQPPWGFDETEALLALVEAGRRIAAQGQPVHVAVKFHPYEDPARTRAQVSALPATAGLRIEFVAPADSPARWIVWADLVAGMTSIVLIEAILAGKPVVSVQPGLTREMMFPPAQLGYTQALTDPATVIEALAGLLGDPAARRALAAELEPFRQAVASADVAATAAWLRHACRLTGGPVP